MAKKMGRPRLYANATARKRAQRAREAASRAHQLDAVTSGVAVLDHADPVGALATWAAARLIVPPGHPRAGEPMALPDFAVAWLRESWDAHESSDLSTARKNAKSQRSPRCSRSAIWSVRCVDRGGAARRRVTRQGQGGGTTPAGCRDCRGVTPGRED